LIGDIAVLATIISLTYESITIISEKNNFNFDNIKPFNKNWAILCGMAVASLEGIGVILPIKENMRDKSKYSLVIIWGTFIIGILLSVFPLIMYICYQDEVKEIVLNNLPLHKGYIQLILIFLIFSILVVYPVTLFPAFRIIENLIFKDIKMIQDTSMFSCNKTSNIQNLIRTGIVSITIVIGVLSINKFDQLLALAGSGIMTPIALILPSLFHYSLYKHKQPKFRSILDLTVAVTGIIFSLVVLVFTFIN
jgi:proton-coupled amino acid transporter